MENGTINVRTRANEILGMKRVDQFAEELKAEQPAPSGAHNNFYDKIWKPENFGFEPAGVTQAAAPVQAAAPIQAAAPVQEAAPVQVAQPEFVDVPYVGAPKVAKKNFSEKLAEIESKLCRKGADIYIGGKQPSFEDNEALEAIGDAIPDAETYPYSFSWYTIVSRFKPEIRAQWGGLKPLKAADWQAAIGKFSNNSLNLISFIRSWLHPGV